MVSLILVTYNRAERLSLSINDILNQTLKDFELIICDDCSTDNTEQICNAFVLQDSRIKYIRNTINKGMPGNLNHGFEMAQYEYIGILHDGDRFAPDLVQRWYDGMNSSPNIGFVFNAIGIADAEDKIKHSHQEFEPGLIRKEYLLRKVFFRRWRFDSPVWGEAMVRKSLLKEYGYFRKEFKFFADVDFWLEVLHTHDVFYIRDVLMVGPDKDIQPRLFADKLIDTYLYMYSMHKYHRKREFKNNPFIFAKEMAIFYTQAYLCLSVNLALILKHNSYGEYMLAGKGILKKSVILYSIWMILLVLSPVIKVVAKK